MTYYIAFEMESGDWDIYKEFDALNNSEAEEYAEETCPGEEWYVLDAEKNNINA